jgi:predicted phosphodiesterase
MGYWVEHGLLDGRVSLIVDHGQEASAYWLAPLRGRHGEQEEGGGGMAIVFAGPRVKADDVMARACSDYLRQNDEKVNIMIVTADTELIQRCRGARVMDPRTLWNDLEALAAQRSDLVPYLTSTDDNDDNGIGQDANANHHHDQRDDEEADVAANSSTRELIDEEIRRSAQLLQAECMLRSLPKQANNKRKAKLQARVSHLREQLAIQQQQRQPRDNGGQSLLDAILHSSETSSSSLDRDGIVSQWERWRQMSPHRRREYTGDRLILAEGLRQKCRAFVSSRRCDPNDMDRQVQKNYPAAAHVRQVNQQQGCKSARSDPPPPQVEMQLPQPNERCDAVEVAATAATTSLRLVVISDTHGLEEQLPNPLPPGDVLLHLGDFTADGEGRSNCVRQKLDDFGTWMAAQPYATKLVVRGNHDPRDWRPPNDGNITYVTKCTRLSIQGFDFVLLPHGAAANGGMHWNKSIVSSAKGGDNNAMIIASHVPPLGLLDRTLSGENVGSRHWLRYLEKARPALWLCGHIHEGRGCVQVTTGRNNQTTTMVVNAANANDGPAERLDHGPVSMQLTRSNDSNNTNSYREDRATTTTTVETLSGNLRPYAQLVTDAQSIEDFFPLTTKKTSGGNSASVNKTELLLAVDLGLKNTGISLFSQKGQLLRYTQHSSTTLERLRHDMAMLMEEWEDSANAADQTITRIAVEGADVALRNVWRDLAAQDEPSRRSLLFVKPEQWRAELLIPKEKTSRDQLKAAARAIAKQVILDYSIDGQAHSGKIQTDVADSLCTGLYVARRLGWIVRDKAVRRYSNGRVIV